MSCDANKDALMSGGPKFSEIKIDQYAQELSDWSTNYSVLQQILSK